MTTLHIGAGTTGSVAAARDHQITVLKARERVVGRVYISLLPQDFRIEFTPGDDAPS